MTAQKQVEASKGETMTLDLHDFGCIGLLRVFATVPKRAQHMMPFFSRAPFSAV